MRTWEDVSLSLYGTEKYAYELALNNDASITDSAPDIKDIKTLSGIETVKRVTSVYKEFSVEPETGLSALDRQLLPAKEGIGYMVIEGEPVFKVG